MQLAADEPHVMSCHEVCNAARPLCLLTILTADWLQGGALEEPVHQGSQAYYTTIVQHTPYILSTAIVLYVLPSCRPVGVNAFSMTLLGRLGFSLTFGVAMLIIQYRWGATLYIVHSSYTSPPSYFTHIGYMPTLVYIHRRVFSQQSPVGITQRPCCTTVVRDKGAHKLITT